MPPKTTASILETISSELRDFGTNVQSTLDDHSESLEKIMEILLGDGKNVPGLASQVQNHEKILNGRSDNRQWMWRTILGAVISAIVAAVVGSAVITQRIDALAESIKPAPALARAAEPTDAPTPTRTPLPTPTASPTSVVTLIPLDDRDVTLLSRLCAVEVRNYGSEKDNACLSLIDTVFERMRKKKMSDGTVEGTITWHCDKTTVACQFPASVAGSCEGIRPEACWYNFMPDIDHFHSVVVQYYLGARGRCSRFIYYADRTTDAGSCVIYGAAPSAMWFHN